MISERFTAKRCSGYNYPMGKIILVSNRLATSVKVREGEPTFSPSVGGLATGLSSLHAQEDSLWVGWSGVAEDDITPELSRRIAASLRSEHKSVSVPLTHADLDQFYYGFCNNIIWPLFHYFPTYVEYDNTLWESYVAVNKRFFEQVAELIEPEDYVWIHDYQLMLLPDLVKDAFPDVKIGFFLHIPFPSYELFRLLPWRHEILTGLLGADLIGFHTYDYARHFLSSVRRITGFEHNMAKIMREHRLIKVDVFPMGIDYEKYSTAPDRPGVQDGIKRMRSELEGQRLILSVDRLDYSKGILQRLRAFQRFLETQRDYHEKVSMVMIVAPSRTEVPQYIELKRVIDELVGEINGTYGTISWTPIVYFYRAFPFEELTALYYLAEILLVTPIRDGMNLIAKEYIAANTQKRGVVILSETAGAARELGEALIVNSSNIDEIADSILIALELPLEERRLKNDRMHRRLSRYNVMQWAHDFMDKLTQTADIQGPLLAKQLTRTVFDRIVTDYHKASRRLLLLDYDGTLTRSTDRPERAAPDEEIKRILSRLGAVKANEVVVISGRGKSFLDEHLGELDITLIGAHGVWMREAGTEWRVIEHISNEWKETIEPILQLHVDRTPGAAVEETEYSLAWHYRRAEPELAAVRLAELKDALLSLTSNLDVSIVDGNKVLEIKNTNVNKGRAATACYAKDQWDFVIAIGDDWTDEDIFTILPSNAYTIRVGADVSSATYYLKSVAEVRELLSAFST